MTGDVPTKRDSRAIERRIDDRFRAFDENLGLQFESLANRLGAFFKHELHRQTIIVFWTQVTVVVSLAILVFLVASSS